MEYPSMLNISCRSSNVIYCITCKTCGKQYVGQTLRRFKERIYKHLRYIDQANKEKPLALHFFSMKHEQNDIEVHIIYNDFDPQRQWKLKVITKTNPSVKKSQVLELQSENPPVHP